MTMPQEAIYTFIVENTNLLIEILCSDYNCSYMKILTDSRSWLTSEIRIN